MKRSTRGEGHLIDNTALKQSLKHTFPFSPQACVDQAGDHQVVLSGELRSAAARGDHGENSFEGRFTAKAEVRACFVQASRESPGKKVRERESSPAPKPIRRPHERMRAHAHARWRAEGWARSAWHIAAAGSMTNNSRAH